MGNRLDGRLPTASGKREYLVVAFDYFSNWIEVEPLSSITDFQVKKFIWTNLITRFGIPMFIVNNR